MHPTRPQRNPSEKFALPPLGLQLSLTGLATPHISVVLMSLHQGRFLGQAIQSVLDQQDVDMQVVIADWGSRDPESSVAMERAVRDSRVQVVSAANDGGAEAYAAALEVCRGEICGVLEGDQFLAEGASAHLRRAFVESRIEVIYGAARRFEDLAGETIGVAHTRVRKSPEETLLLSDSYCPPATWWRTEVLRKLGPPRSDFALTWGQHQWALYVVRSGTRRCAKCNALLAHIREHPESQSAGNLSRVKQERYAQWLDLFRSFAAPQPFMDYCAGLTAFTALPVTDWRPSPEFQPARLLAGFARQVAKLYYYDGARQNAKVWLRRAIEAEGWNVANLRWMLKLRMG
jgi:hypothetical protein